MAFYCSISFYFCMDSLYYFSKYLHWFPSKTITGPFYSIRDLFLCFGAGCFPFWEYPAGTKPLELSDSLELVYQDQ